MTRHKWQIPRSGVAEGRTLFRVGADAFANCKLDYEALTGFDGELDVAFEFIYENSVKYQ